MSAKPNVVLIVLDSARADAFGSHSPNLWAFGAGGVRFDQAVTAAGWTLPSHASLFTGLLPTEHGLVGLPGGSERVLRNARGRVKSLLAENRLLAPRMRDLGYRTLSATASPWLSRGSGLDAGFDDTDFFNFMQLPLRKRWQLPKRVRQSVDTARSVGDHARWIASERDKGARRVVDRIASFARKDGGPFFAFTTLMETHEPHFPLPPGPRGLSWYRSNFGAMANTVLQPGLLRLVRMHAHNWGTLQLSPKTIARWQHAYASEVAYVDRCIADLCSSLDAAGILGDTLFIVTGDHGETWGEGGTVGHGLSLREGLANVPLFIWGAGVDRRSPVTEPVSLTEVAAFIEGAAEGRTAGVLDPATWGRAIMEVEEPSHVAHPAPRPGRVAAGPGAAFYDGSLKLVSEPFVDLGTTPQLFDLSRDPHERAPLSAQPTDWQKGALDEWRRRNDALGALLTV